MKPAALGRFPFGNRGFDLNPRKASVLVSHDENIITDIHFRNRGVIAAKQVDCHHGKLAATPCIQVVFSLAWAADCTDSKTRTELNTVQFRSRSSLVELLILLSRTLFALFLFSQLAFAADDFGSDDVLPFVLQFGQVVHNVEHHILDDCS